MSKIATISCIILAVSISLEGTQASLLGNRRNDLLGKLQDAIADGTGVLQNIRKDASDLLVGKIGDLTNELNLDGEVAVPTGLMSCSKLPDDVKNVVNATIQAVSNVQSCVSTELQTAGNDVQVIAKLVKDLLTTVGDRIYQAIQALRNSGNILERLRNIPKVLSDLVKQLQTELTPKVNEINSKVQNLVTEVTNNLKSCVQKSNPNVQEGVQNGIADLKDCIKSITS